VGWGDSDNVRTSEYLLKGDLKIQNRSVCSQFESYELKSQLCVGGFVNGVPGLSTNFNSKQKQFVMIILISDWTRIL